jgi:hypothetical protein
MDEIGGTSEGGEDVGMDNGTDDVVYGQEYIEFKKDGRTVRLRATSSLLGVPLLSDEIMRTAPPVWSRGYMRGHGKRKRVSRQIA